MGLQPVPVALVKQCPEAHGAVSPGATHHLFAACTTQAHETSTAICRHNAEEKTNLSFVWVSERALTSPNMGEFSRELWSWSGSPLPHCEASRPA